MLGAAVGVGLLALLAAVELGQVSIRLPFPPGVEYDYMASSAPPGSLPPQWDASFVVPNDALTTAVTVLKDKVIGAETVTLAPDGRMGVVDKWGRIFVAEPDGFGGFTLPEADPLAWSSPGRTLGVKFDLDGSIYIANAPLGLMQLLYPGDVEQQRLVLSAGRVADESPLMAGFPLEFVNALDIGADGTVFFSHSSDVIPYKTEDGSWEVLDSVFVTVAKAAPAGMLLAYNPTTGAATALMSGLWFANGVAVAHDGSFVLVGDSVTMTIHRHWLTGPKAGSNDVFMSHLPGPVDGISRSEDGRTYWVTIYSKPPMVLAHTRSRLVRLLFAWAPRIMRALKLQLPKWGLVLRVDGGGSIVQVLGDPTGRVVAGVTSATEAAGKLYLGSIAGNGVQVVDLAAVAAATAQS